MMRGNPFYLWLTGRGWKFFVSLFVISAAIIGLLVARPWEASKYECAVTVRPGESIQVAIDAAGEGDVICLARGVWAEIIVIDRSLTLVGRGAGRTTIEAAVISGPAGQIAGQDAGQIVVSLEGLTMSGRGGASTVEVSGGASAEVRDCMIFGQLFGVQVSDSAGLSLIGSTVSDSPQHAVLLTGSASASIVGSRIQENRGHGLLLSGSARATLLDSSVSGNNGIGLWLRDEARVVLTGSSVSNNREHGIRLTGRSQAQLVRTQVSGNADYGITAEDSVELEMADSQVQSNWHGIEVSREARATIVGSSVSGSRFDGVRVHHSAHAAISACSISSNRRGVWIGGAGQAEIEGCLIEGNVGYGIFSSSHSETTGEENRFYGNGIDLGGSLSGALRVPLKDPRESVITWPDERYASLQEAVDALLPAGRLVLEPGEYATALTIGKELVIEAGDGRATLSGKSAALPVMSLVDGADLHLSGATISGGAEGLLISAGARALVLNSTISRNGDGINLPHWGSMELVNSSIIGNESRGIYVGGTSRASVTSSLISNNTEHGIAAADSAQITVTGSTIARNGGAGGVVVWGSPEAVLDGNTIVENTGFGVAIFQRPAFWRSPWPFRGSVSGSSNVFGDNRLGDVTPPELDFLSTAEGGELVLRR